MTAQPLDTSPRESAGQEFVYSHHNGELLDAHLLDFPGMEEAEEDSGEGGTVLVDGDEVIYIDTFPADVLAIDTFSEEA